MRSFLTSTRTSKSKKLRTAKYRTPLPQNTKNFPGTSNATPGKDPNPHWILTTYSTNFHNFPQPDKIQKLGSQKALIIGQNHYIKERGPLDWCQDDAMPVKTALNKLGWETTLHLDVPNEKDMEKIVTKFLDQIQRHDDAIFYYAGHGTSEKGYQAILPTQRGTYNVGDLMERVSDKELGVFGFIFDCCREIRTGRNAREKVKPMVSEPARGTYIVYATTQGKLSEENQELKHGVFTHSFVKHLENSAEDPINDFFVKVRKDVLKATNDEQSPWISHSLSSTKYCIGKQSSQCF